MTETIDWQTILFLAGLIAVWSLIIIATLRWIQDRSTRKLEIDFLKFQATLPIEYVRREDAIRQEVVINSKLDALAKKFDQVGLKGKSHE